MRKITSLILLLGAFYGGSQIPKSDLDRVLQHLRKTVVHNKAVEIQRIEFYPHEPQTGNGPTLYGYTLRVEFTRNDGSP